jgi:hypothetical protein
MEARTSKGDRGSSSSRANKGDKYWLGVYQIMEKAFPKRGVHSKFYCRSVDFGFSSRFILTNQIRFLFQLEELLLVAGCNRHTGKVPLVFDSYEKEDRTRKSGYTRYVGVEFGQLEDPYYQV